MPKHLHKKKKKINNIIKIGNFNNTMLFSYTLKYYITFWNANNLNRILKVLSKI